MLRMGPKGEAVEGTVDLEVDAFNGILSGDPALCLACVNSGPLQLAAIFGGDSEVEIDAALFLSSVSSS